MIWWSASDLARFCPPNAQRVAFLELKTKLEHGAAEAEAGELFDGNEVFEELREMIAERLHAKGL